MFKPRSLALFVSTAVLLSLSAALLAQNAAQPAAAPAAPAAGQPANEPPDKLWEDFAHYVQIARPDLAKLYADALMQSVNDQQLLDVVEASPRADHVDQLILRAIKTDALTATAKTLATRLRTARLSRAREPQRIDDDIQRLGEGERARINAIVRLRAADQYAASHFLKALQDERQKRLHPYILSAMVTIGRPLVYPMSVALPDLEPVTQGQVAQVLAEIGYPRPLPYMLRIVEDPKTDEDARVIVRSAYERLSQAQRLPSGVSSAELFLLLGQNVYTAATSDPLSVPGYDTLTQKGIVWRYDHDAGLVPVPVPGQIFGDVLARDAADRALMLKPGMDAALSLWLMANLRRENRLAQGEQDLSYPARLHEPAFYLMMAGPLRQHDVLARALRDHDPALALDAVAALDATAGTDALVNREGTIQPLLQALQYPDRRVRFRAAIALTNARPKAEFPGSSRVVSVLSEAVRQSDVRYAVAIGRDQDTVNKLNATLRELNYTPLGGTSLEGVAELVRSGPGVDLIMTRLNMESVDSILHLSAQDYRLAAVPVVAVVEPGEQIQMRKRYTDQPEENRLYTVAVGSDDQITGQTLGPAVAQARQAYAGSTIEAAEAEQFALEALRLLREVALTAGEVYTVTDAEPALLQALNDRREKIVERAGGVLSLINDPQAQAAIADAAFDANKPDELRISLLGSLAESATYFGTLLNEPRLQKLLDIVNTSKGNLAVASARAHGALTLPTADAVELIVGKPTAAPAAGAAAPPAGE